MKVFLCLLLAVGVSSAQLDASKIVSQAFKQALVNVSPVPDQDKQVILRETTAILSRHITLDANGDASAIFRISENRPVEWKKFAINNITQKTLTEADTLNGIAKRYLVSFTCSAHRSWDAKTNGWGQWHPFGNGRFPSAIFLELKGGKWLSPNTQQLDYFTPAAGAPAPSRPTPRDPSGLPPGMTRKR
jgi:hypothetical protein